MERRNHSTHIHTLEYVKKSAHTLESESLGQVHNEFILS